MFYGTMATNIDRTPTPVTILYSTQSGRAKACARRSSRLLRSNYPSIVINGHCTFDDFGVNNFLSLDNTLLLLFVSTTGDGEHTTSIAKTWSALLSKSLPSRLFVNVSFALFALGDRAYGDAFCAAGRKLAARLVQLGASPKCVLGYGDDGSGAGVLGDLDVWLGERFFAVLDDNSKAVADEPGTGAKKELSADLLYSVEFSKEVHSALQSTGTSGRDIQEWQKNEYMSQYAHHFQYSCPDTAYQYNNHLVRYSSNQSNDLSSNDSPNLTPHTSPLLGYVTVNDRLTPQEWMQNTRHLRIHVTKQMQSTSTTVQDSCNMSTCSLPYQAGDVATILPSNPQDLVSKFLSILPASLRAIADETLQIQRINYQLTSTSHPWPELCTFRGLLTCEIFGCAIPLLTLTTLYNSRLFPL
jgi:sulfite reductase alpha subunit-like flavoprotein